jgi:general secretion pathway protein C
MELAKNLTEWRDRAPEQWVALAGLHLPPIVVALFVILIAYQAVGLTWRLLESPADQDFVPAAIVTPQAGGGTGGALTTSLDVLRTWRPFGEPPQLAEGEGVTVGELLDAPETTLPIELNSFLVAQELPEDRDARVVPEKGAAIIVPARGRMKVYFNGDMIEDANGDSLNATLYAVYADRVVIDRGGGRLETLFKPDDNESASSARQSNSRITPTQRPEPPQPQDNIADQVAFIESIGAVAGAMNQYITTAQHQENGQLVGIRLQPKGEQGQQAFNTLGLQAGDVLTEVNGIPLNDARNTGQVFNALGENPQAASVSILRNGNVQALIIDISPLLQMAESLQ